MTGRRLTPMQREQLEYVYRHGAAHGNSNTVSSLTRRGFVTWDPVLKRLALTDNGERELAKGLEA